MSICNFPDLPGVGFVNIPNTGKSNQSIGIEEDSDERQ